MEKCIARVTRYTLVVFTHIQILISPNNEILCEHDMHIDLSLILYTRRCKHVYHEEVIRVQ